MDDNGIDNGIGPNSASVTMMPDANFDIGWYRSDFPQAFNGLIDDVRIYNYARTAEQIKNDYVIGLKGHEE